MRGGQHVFAAIVAALLAVSIAHATAQVYAPGQPPRDHAPGTAVIRGRVVDAVTGSPVGRARVRLSGRLARPLVLTDADGRFAFTELARGEWTLTAEKAAYMPTQFPPPGRTLRTMRRPLFVAEGAVVDNITIPLHGVSAISGRVLDVHGDLVDYASVRVLRVSGSTGVQAVSGTSTNEFGEFRAGRIEPGTYLLQAIPNDRGSEVSADTKQVPTFYPGVLSVDQAQPITVRRGHSVGDLDIVLQEGTPTIVTGTVIDARGQPARHGYVNARIIGEGIGGWPAGGTPIKQDGTFQLKLALGEYMLDAQGIRPSPESTRPEDEHSGSVRAILTGGAVDVVIRVGPPSTITGTIVFDGTAALPDPKQVHLRVSGGEAGYCRGGRVEVAADWTFKLTGLGDSCTIEGGGMSWRLRSVVIGQEDFAGRAITLETGQHVRGVRVILSDRRSGITLRVDDEHGQPTREYAAIVFPTDRTRWKNWNYSRTYVPPTSAIAGVARPAGQAQPGAPAPPPAPREMVDLLPGEYFVAAIEDIDAEVARSPATFEKLSAQATRVTVPDGAHTDVGLRRLRKPQ